MARTRPQYKEVVAGYYTGAGGHQRFWRRTMIRRDMKGKNGRMCATYPFTKTEMKKLKAHMSSVCLYCGKKLEIRTSVFNHLLKDCTSISFPEGRLKEAFTDLRRKGAVTVKRSVSDWNGCPLEGYSDITMGDFPEGIVCAPFIWGYFIVDEIDGKTTSYIRGNNQAFLYERPGKNETRRRFYSDRQVHLKWEAVVRKKNGNGEVSEILIPNFYWYWVGDDVEDDDPRNHCALIVIRIVDGQWTASFYDSQLDGRYYLQACSQEFYEFLQTRLLGNMKAAPRQDPDDSWLKQMPVYPSLCGKGCLGVLAFWTHLRSTGKELVHPNNTETVQFFKAVLFHVPDIKRPHPLMRGEDFDREWKLKSARPYNVGERDPEIQGHINEIIKMIRRVHVQGH